MNQAIHFPDREIWDENKQAVCFPVLVHGMQLTCAIKGETLHQRGNDSNLLIVFYVQIMPDDFVMQLHRF